MTTDFNFTGRIRSFRHAIRGISTILRTQQNAWIHAAVTISVILLGLLLKIRTPEWCWIVLAIISVWIAEALNTAFEFLFDVASPEFHPKVKQAKDVAAGAVLLAALGSVVIGILVFSPYLLME
jgi:diacylglycerol kinase (ATP)